MIVIVSGWNRKVLAGVNGGGEAEAVEAAAVAVEPGQLAGRCGEECANASELSLAARVSRAETSVGGAGGGGVCVV